MSKRIFQHPEVPASEKETEVWRSIGELEKSPQFRTWMEREFPEGSGELSKEDRELSRRNFVKLMGASSALAGLTLASCRRPESYILPLKDGPEWQVPGKALYYATSMPRAGGSVPLVVTSNEGRPTKLEPNGTAPDGGGTDAFTQASILDLYSPSRSRDVLKGGKKASGEEFAKAMSEALQGGAKLGIVFGEDDSPTRNRIVEELGAKFAGAKFYAYEPLAGQARKEVCEEAFGAEGATAVADYSKAKRILSLDADFVSLDLQGQVKPFFAGRQGGGADYKNEIDPEKMNRLYVVETAFSMTGGMADHRLRATPGEVFKIARELAHRIWAETQDETLGAMLSALGETAPLMDLTADDLQWKEEWIKQCAFDLVAHKGEALVLAGSRHDEGLQRLVIAMNAALESLGDDKPLRPLQTGKTGYGTLADLVSDLGDGAVDTVILMTPGNPVYDAPSDLKFGEVLKKATLSVHVGLTTNATAAAADWHVPAAHYLESWGDTRTFNGTYSLVQPMILPLYGGVSELDLLAQLSAWGDVDRAKVESGEAEAPVLLSGEGVEGAPSPGYVELRKTFKEIGGEEEANWKEALKAGFFAESAYAGLGVSNAKGLAPDKTKTALITAFIAQAASAKNLEVNFATDGSVYDGRYIDNGWLQEAPDPISKLTWDNAALVSPQTAKELGVYETIVALETKRAARPEIGEGRDAAAPMMTVNVNGVELEVPVVVAFGHADNCVTIALGYGHDPKHVGLVGRGSGFNAYKLRNAKSSLYATGATAVASEGKTYPVAFTQEHHAMYGRALAREISTNEVKHKSFEQQLADVRIQGIDSHVPENKSFYKPKGSSVWEEDEDKVENLISDKIHQWGMTIDLNTCMGCNACLVACQAENNIPIVGKEQVAMGREMHWIRMDRYYAAPKFERDGHGHKEKVKGEEGEKTHKAVPAWVSDNPEMIPQPVACVQCESAPCEVVCPVNATVHTEEGLNAMAYNRCIGTRYCANNCPYKARRFNYFDYNKRNPLIEKNLYKGPLGETQVGTSKHLQHNPNVTVRMRGVMEKCTYCVQRLEGAKIKQKQVQRAKALGTANGSKDVTVTAEDLRIGADSVKTACQDACPADAISFGNLLNTDSQVFRAKYYKEKVNGEWKPKPRNYDLLNYIGTIPRTSYLARVKNPNKDMPDAQYRGQATIHMT